MSDNHVIAPRDLEPISFAEIASMPISDIIGAEVWASPGKGWEQGTWIEGTIIQAGRKTADVATQPDHFRSGWICRRGWNQLRWRHNKGISEQ